MIYLDYLQSRINKTTKYYTVLDIMSGDMCPAPGIISLTPLSLVTNMTDMALGASGLWLENQTGTAGTALV